MIAFTLLFRLRQKQAEAQKTWTHRLETKVTDRQTHKQQKLFQFAVLFRGVQIKSAHNSIQCGIMIKQKESPKIMYYVDTC